MLPIVLHHGFGFGDLRVGRFRVPYFSGIEDAIAARGHPILVTHVHPTASIATRAQQLKNSIVQFLDTRETCDERIILLGHSMGGLDARYMISKLGMADRVAALITVTTPHRGSPYANWMVKHVGQRLGGFALMDFLGWDFNAANDLTTESCQRFNNETPDAPGVRYVSVSAARPWHRVPAFAMHAHRVIADAEGDNDSLVSVQSSRWGEHLGIWPADHWHTINRRYSLEFKDRTGDISPYYLRLLDHLAAVQ